ncbi:MAG: hypothetical protein FWC68_06705 [Oscillospiraceae bacterium]|nr:hypothetical protein [Oscillospiraceae bacterium]
MEKEKIAMVTIIGLMCAILTALIVIQFRTIDPERISALELMREEELRTGIAILEERHEEVMQRIGEVNEYIEEYQEIIMSGAEASEVFGRELQRSMDLARKNGCYR